MLILSRKTSEKIVLDNGVEIMVTEIRPGSVRLGITAPEGVVIDREEVHQRRIMQVSAAMDTGTLAQCEDQFDYQENAK